MFDVNTVVPVCLMLALAIPVVHWAITHVQAVKAARKF